MILEAAAFWHQQNIKTAVFELEEDRKYHLFRALSQRIEKAKLFDENWLRQHGDYVRKICLENEEFLNSFGKCIYQAPDEQMTLDQLADWTKLRASQGYRVIVIDPVTAARAEDKPWIADNEFLLKVKVAVRKYNSSLILVTHPKKGRKSAVGMDELAGGAAYARFAQTIFWLENHKDLKDVTVETPVGRCGCQINRTLRICKTRNGKGQGLNIGFNFLGHRLTFTEEGVIIPDEQ
jgi:hypothetical protein